MIPGVSQNLVSLGIALMLFWGAFALFALWKVNGRRTRNAFALLLLLGAFLHGSFVFSKGDGPQNAPRRRTATPTPMSDFSPAQKQARFALSGCSTNAAFDLAMPANAVVHQPWLVRGAASDGFFISSTNAFFRLGTNEVRFARIDSSGMIGFSPRRRDAEPVEMPDSDGDAFLAPLRASLGIVPESNGARAGVAESCVWHAETADGLLVTWQEALADRVPSNAVTFQVELRRTGDFVYRYDIPAGTVVSNFVIGAQNEGGGETALIDDGGLGCTEGHRCATVWDGATEHPLCEHLAPDGILRGPLRFELRWTSLAELDPDDPDCDGDGLSNRDEVCRYHTDPSQSDSDLDGIPDGTEVADDSDPLDPDEDGNGIPDGVSPAVWSSNSLWGDVSGKTNLVLSLDAPIPPTGAATLRLGNLSIPLRTARSWALCIPEGPITPFKLRTVNGAMAALSLAGPPGGAPDPIHLDDPDGVFRVSVPRLLRAGSARGASAGGSGHLCVFDVRFVNWETGEPAPDDECIHDADGVRRLTLQFSNPFHAGVAPTWASPAVSDVPGWTWLCVSDEPGDTDTASVTYSSPQLVCGTKTLTASIHRCQGGHVDWCEACCMYHDADDDSSCPHAAECPAKTNATAECACPIPVIRVSGAGTSLSEIAAVHFPEGKTCCCSADSDAPFARILHIDPNISVTNENGVAIVSDTISGAAGIYAAGHSGTEPSRVDYEIVRHRYDPVTGTSTEETTNRTMKVWALDILHEPISTDQSHGSAVNPCGIVLGHTARFRIEVTPSSFPDNLISWEADPAYRVDFPYGNQGREVIVRGARLGDVILTVQIQGYAGPPPVCNAKVVLETTIPVHAFIICDENGIPSRTESNVQELFTGVNEIYSQVGRHFSITTFTTITNQNWLVVLQQNGRWPKFHSIVNYTNGTEAIEMYFNQTIAGANGLANQNGLLIARSGNSNTVAHELGHVHGFPDIYVTRPESNLVAGSAAKEFLPADWGSGSEEGYYPPGILQSSIIYRLLMYGVGSDSKRDIPLGNIHGLWYPESYSRPIREGLVPLGFFTNGISFPVSQ